MTFEELVDERGVQLLDDALLKFVRRKGFTTPSPIQKAVIPLFSGHKDVAVEACTGSGKTLAYLLPIFIRLKREDHVTHKIHLLWIHSVVIGPTRELVQQIAGVAREILSTVQEYETPALAHCSIIELFGGRKASADALQVMKATHDKSRGIIITTPGRLRSQLMEGKDSTLRRERHWSFKECEVLVIDEADKLFGEPNFLEQMSMCLSCLPKQRRTGVFSATLTSENRALSLCGMRNPWIIKLGFENAEPTSATQPDATATTQMGDEEILASHATETEDDSDRVRSDESALSDTGDALSDAEELQGDVVDGGVIKRFEVDEAADEDVVITAHYMPIGLRNYFAFAEQDERIPILMKVIENEDYHKVLVFTSSCASTDFTYNILNAYYSPTEFAKIIKLHGKLERSMRQKALYEFGESERVKTEAGNVQKRVLVASDLAARGIDFQKIDLIVQIDPPNDPSQIFHRMGRTARAGGRGDTLLLISGNERAFLTLMEGKGVTFATDFPLDCSFQSTRGRLDNGDLQTKMPTPLPEKLSDMRVYVHQFIQDQLKQDRFLLEKAREAFISHVRAYKEHRLSFMFKFDELDIGKVANRFGLFRIPHVKELRSHKAGEKKEWQNFLTSTFDDRQITFKSDAQAAKFEVVVQKRKEKREVERIKAAEFKAKREEMQRAKKSASARRRRRRDINVREEDEELRDMALIKKRKRTIKRLREAGHKISKAFLLDDEKPLSEALKNSDFAANEF